MVIAVAPTSTKTIPIFSPPNNKAPKPIKLENKDVSQRIFWNRLFLKTFIFNEHSYHTLSLFLRKNESGVRVKWRQLYRRLFFPSIQVAKRHIMTTINAQLKIPFRTDRHLAGSGDQDNDLSNKIRASSLLISVYGARCWSM